MRRLLLFALLLVALGARAQTIVGPPSAVPSISVTVSYVLTNYNTNIGYMSGSGTAAANTSYGYESNWNANGWIYTNAAGYFFMADYSGAGDAGFLLSNSTNTQTATSLYINTGYLYKNGWAQGPGSGTLPVPTFVWATNTVTNTTSFYVRSIGTNHIITCPPGCYLPAAANYAQPGDLIEVEPGVYNCNNLLRNGVNWTFKPGASVFYTNFDSHYWQAEDLPGYFAIWDDTAQGAVTSNITGGSFNVRTSHPFCPGVIWTVNAGTRLNINCSDMSCRVWGAGPGNSTIATNLASRQFYGVSNCALDVVTCGLATCTNADTTSTLWNNTLGQLQATTGLEANGFVWRMGEAHFNCPAVIDDAQAIWATGKTDGSGDSSMFYTGQYLRGTLYNDSLTTNSVMWANVQYIDGSASQFSALNLYGGKNYVTAEKVLGSTSGSLGAAIQDASYNWITIQKFTAQGTFIGFSVAPGASGYTTAGITWLNVQQFEETGTGITKGIYDVGSNNCSLYLSGGQCKIHGSFLLNGQFSASPNSPGGNVRSISGLIVDNSVGTSNTFGVYTNGLALYNCTITSPSGVAPITTLGGTSKETVTAVNVSQTGANGANVSLLGSITTNAVVGGATLKITNGIVGAATIP